MKKQTVRMDTTNDDREDNMKNITCKLSLAIIVCATLCLGCTYTYTEVLPPGWRNAHATSINDNGDVAGWGDDSTGKFKGFVYSGGNYTELLAPGWDWAAAYSINNNGDVAGEGFDGTGTSKGFVYSGGNYTELLLPGSARSINDNGDVAGDGVDSTGTLKGFVYSGGNYTELLPPGWSSAVVYSINNNGDVAGRGVDGTGKSKGFVYSGGVYTEMLPPGWSRSRSIEKLRFYIDSQVFTYCINNKGTVVITRSISRYFIAIPLPTIIKSFIATPRQRARNS